MDTKKIYTATDGKNFVDFDEFVAYQNSLYKFTTDDGQEFSGNDYDAYLEHKHELEIGLYSIIDNRGDVYSGPVQGYSRVQYMLDDWISKMLNDGMTQEEIDDLELIIV